MFQFLESPMKSNQLVKPITPWIALLAAMTLLGCSEQTALTPAENISEGRLGVDTEEPSFEEGSNASTDTTPTIINFFQDELTEGVIPGQGLHGRIFYLLNRNLTDEIPDFLEDKNGRLWAFPDGVTSVNDIIDNGFELRANILLTDVFVPTASFRDGFKGPNGAPIENIIGEPLFEGFALDVQGGLQLGQGMAPGQYEIAILSDDGAILSADFDGDGGFETTLINNDGSHSTQMGCSNTILNIQEDTEIPIRLKYFQGPREHISLVLLMRPVGSGEVAGADPSCGFDDNFEWFDFTDTPDYVPNLVDSMYGDLIQRGWFRPTRGALTN